MDRFERKWIDANVHGLMRTYMDPFEQKWIDSRLAWGSSPRSNKRRKGNMNQIHSQLVERLWRPGK